VSSKGGFSLPWWRGRAEHTDGRQSEEMTDKFDFVVGSEYRSDNIMKWDADRRTGNQRPIEADRETIETI
jgi:hypothetical protein